MFKAVPGKAEPFQRFFERRNYEASISKLSESLRVEQTVETVFVFMLGHLAPG